MKEKRYKIKFFISGGLELNGETDEKGLNGAKQFMEFDTGTFTFIGDERTQIIDRRFLKVIDYWEVK